MSFTIDLHNLKELAENARSEAETWWLWDEPLVGDSGPMLAFAHAATPETVLALIRRIKKLEEENDPIIYHPKSIDLFGPDGDPIKRNVDSVGRGLPGCLCVNADGSPGPFSANCPIHGEMVIG
jgi:hypothetical protein